MTRVQVCETVMAESMAGLLAGREAAREGHLVELRLDGVHDANVGVALAGRRRPAVVTCRPAWEGGRYRGDESSRLDLLREAVRHGAEFVDCEAAAGDVGLSGGGSRVVLSHHDFEETPRDLAARVQAIRARRPDVLKVAVLARALMDCVRIRDAVRHDEGPRVVIAMGEAGVLSRVCPWLFGSCWSYAGHAAPGQPAVGELVDEYRVTERTPASLVFGTAGSWERARPLAAAHNAAFRARGCDALSVPLVTEDDDELRAVVAAFGLAGTVSAGQPGTPDELRTRADRDVDRWTVTAF